MTSTIRNESGFSMVEILVSLTLLSIGLLGLAGMTLQAARRARGVSHLTTVSQVMTQQVNRLGVLPYDSLPVGTNCRAVTANGFGYTRCVAVVVLSPSVKQVTLTMTPVNSAIRPVVEVFRRTLPPASYALNR
jgi:prepilin-type N-terminal cleavage/methylation domain-containing protein